MCCARPPADRLLKLDVPTQANLSDCVDKGVLSLTAAGAQRVVQHRASAMGHAGTARRDGGPGGAGCANDGNVTTAPALCIRGGPRGGGCSGHGPGDALIAAMSP